MVEENMEDYQKSVGAEGADNIGNVSVEVSNRDPHMIVENVITTLKLCFVKVLSKYKKYSVVKMIYLLKLIKKHLTLDMLSICKDNLNENIYNTFQNKYNTVGSVDKKNTFEAISDLEGHIEKHVRKNIYTMFENVCNIIRDMYEHNIVLTFKNPKDLDIKDFDKIFDGFRDLTTSSPTPAVEKQSKKKKIDKLRSEKVQSNKEMEQLKIDSLKQKEHTNEKGKKMSKNNTKSNDGVDESKSVESNDVVDKKEVKTIDNNDDAVNGENENRQVKKTRGKTFTSRETVETSASEDEDEELGLKNTNENNTDSKVDAKSVEMKEGMEKNKKGADNDDGVGGDDDKETKGKPRAPKKKKPTPDGDLTADDNDDDDDEIENKETTRKPRASKKKKQTSDDDLTADDDDDDKDELKRKPRAPKRKKPTSDDDLTDDLTADDNDDDKDELKSKPRAPKRKKPTSEDNLINDDEKPKRKPRAPKKKKSPPVDDLTADNNNNNNNDDDNENVKTKRKPRAPKRKKSTTDNELVDKRMRSEEAKNNVLVDNKYLDLVPKIPKIGTEMFESFVENNSIIKKKNEETDSPINTDEIMTSFQELLPCTKKTMINILIDEHLDIVTKEREICDYLILHSLYDKYNTDKSLYYTKKYTIKDTGNKLRSDGAKRLVQKMITFMAYMFAVRIVQLMVSYSKRNSQDVYNVISKLVYPTDYPMNSDVDNLLNLNNIKNVFIYFKYGKAAYQRCFTDLRIKQIIKYKFTLIQSKMLTNMVSHYFTHVLEGLPNIYEQNDGKYANTVLQTLLNNVEYENHLLHKIMIENAIIFTDITLNKIEAVNREIISIIHKKIDNVHLREIIHHEYIEKRIKHKKMILWKNCKVLNVSEQKEKMKILYSDFIENVQKLQMDLVTVEEEVDQDEGDKNANGDCNQEKSVDAS